MSPESSSTGREQVAEPEIRVEGKVRVEPEIRVETREDPSSVTPAMATTGTPLPPGPAPRRPSVSTVLGILFALLLFALGVVAIHDAIAGWGLIDRVPLHDQALRLVDGFRPDERMLAASILALIVGGVLIIAALRQRRYETYRLKAVTGVHLARADLARLIEDELREIPGISTARVRAAPRAIRVEVTTTGGDGILELAEQASRRRLEDLAEKPKLTFHSSVAGNTPGPARKARKGSAATAGKAAL